ncbi:MAG: peptide ABC transporter substrate-binding protein, partial [Oscillospiraceae bacterium]|nr:peptide ABC transporter substrate-binding protein [Oscillospiraceae bacterium]
TFPAGTYYGEIMQAQIDADGITMKVWNAETFSGDGFDGWYNPDAAAAEMAVAIEELAAIGIEVSPENPIYIDLPYASHVESYTNQANAFKQSVETVLGGCVIVNLTACVDYDEWYNTGYYTNYGYEANYDIYDLSGWGPDYGDPQTYLDTFLPDYAGYMIKCIGIF